MQSSMQRRKLLKSMNAEPVHAWMILAKCAAGLAVIVLIAVIGVSAPLDFSAPSLGAVSAKAAPGAREQLRSQPHRKQLFDERRARFENGDKRNNRMTEIVDLPKDLPMEPL